MEIDSYNQLSQLIIGAAINVHRQLGPGLLENAYEACLEYELLEKGCLVERQKPLPVVYKQIKVECGFRIDLLVDRKIIVEVKAVDALAPIHNAQLLSYLKLSKCKLGLLINFNAKLLKNGIRRIANGL